MRTAGLANGVVLLLGLSVWLGWCVVEALRSGIAHAGARDYRRSKKPLMYGLAVGIQFLLALLFFYGALWGLVRMFGFADEPIR